jgi:hypothetical protein
VFPLPWLLPWPWPWPFLLPWPWPEPLPSRCGRILSRLLAEPVMVRWSLTTTGIVPVAPGLVPGRALRLGLAEDGWRAGGPAAVPPAECPGADGSAPARCWTGATPAVTASTMPMSPAIAAQARTRTGLRRGRPASTRAREAGWDAAGNGHQASSATTAGSIAEGDGGAGGTAASG